jgi:hypothetical protein
MLHHKKAKLFEEASNCADDNEASVPVNKSAEC